VPDAVALPGGRDRDARGRARNARPRDAAGRPLPRAAAGVEQLPDELDLTPEDALAAAQRLLDADRPFHAHEVLEAAWKAAPDAQRELWRGLAQLAVGLTHVQRGNRRGSVALLRRAADRIGEWAGPPPHGLDLAGLQAQADALAGLVERAGTGAVAPERLRVRLRG
jgi:predicted metal-dependent hydrolase